MIIKFFMYLVLVSSFMKCGTTQKRVVKQKAVQEQSKLLGNWLLVKENDDFIFDCHEVLMIKRNVYKVFDCDIDYSETPTLLEKGKIVINKATFIIKKETDTRKRESFFMSKNREMTFDFKKIMLDSLIISSRDKNIFKFRRVNSKLNVD